MSEVYPICKKYRDLETIEVSSVSTATALDAVLISEMVKKPFISFACIRVFFVVYFFHEHCWAIFFNEGSAS